MSVHLQREMESLKKRLLTLSALVEDRLVVAFRAAERGDCETARRFAAEDAPIDRMEVEIEEECLKVLALHQPVAIDLRRIVAILKINNDLERLGDHAVNIADKIERLGGALIRPPANGLGPLFDRALQMLGMSMDAFVRTDPAVAHEVCAMDDEVDALKHDMREKVLAVLKECPGEARAFLAVLGVARNLERVGDLATNIAEDVIYMTDGLIIRHLGETPDAPSAR